MRNNKPVPSSKLKVGMRVKIPWNGSWFSSNKRFLWFKGTITDIRKNNNQVTCVEISVRNCHGYDHFGRCLCLSNNIKHIYKQL